MSYYAKLPWRVAVKAAAMAKGRDGKEPHQWRLRPQDLRRAANRLVSAEEELRGCQDFDAIYNTVLTSRVKGLGKLWAYDTALRIGVARNIYPTLVYLHRGTKVGAKALGFRGQNTLTLSDFADNYRALLRLDPYQIEDFLCLAKDRLRRVRWAMTKLVL